MVLAQRWPVYAGLSSQLSMNCCNCPNYSLAATTKPLYTMKPLGHVVNLPMRSPPMLDRFEQQIVLHSKDNHASHHWYLKVGDRSPKSAICSSVMWATSPCRLSRALLALLYRNRRTFTAVKPSTIIMSSIPWPNRYLGASWDL